MIQPVASIANAADDFIFSRLSCNVTSCLHLLNSAATGRDSTRQHFIPKQTKIENDELLFCNITRAAEGQASICVGPPSQLRALFCYCSLCPSCKARKTMFLLDAHGLAGMVAFALLTEVTYTLVKKWLGQVP